MEFKIEPIQNTSTFQRVFESQRPALNRFVPNYNNKQLNIKLQEQISTFAKIEKQILTFAKNLNIITEF